METLISAEFDPSTLAQIMLFILKAFPLAEELLRAAAKDAVTAYLAVLPVIFYHASASILMVYLSSHCLV